MSENWCQSFWQTLTCCLVWVSLLLTRAQLLVNRMERCEWKPSGFTASELCPSITAQCVQFLTVVVLWWVRWTTDVHLLNYSSSKTLKTTAEQKGAIYSSCFAIRQEPFRCICLYVLSNFLSENSTSGACALFLGKSFLCAVRPCSSDAAFLPHPMYLI